MLVVALQKDPIVRQEPARRSGAFWADISIVDLAGASHWVLHAPPEAASALLLDFFGTARGRAGETAPPRPSHSGRTASRSRMKRSCRKKTPPTSGSSAVRTTTSSREGTITTDWPRLPIAA